MEFQDHYKYKTRLNNDDFDYNYDVEADDFLPI